MDSSANSNHFVKIILFNDVDSLTKLMIPKKFVMKHGDNMHTRMKLKTPNGLAWLVDLQRHKDDIWIHNGWDKFVKFYSIQLGYMLVFKYQGDSNFHVLIFDSSLTEIDYPLMTNNANPSFAKSTQVRKRVDDIIDVDLRPCKKNIATEVDGHDKESLKPKSQQKKSKGECSESATKEAKIRAQAFQSSNPFFVVSIKPSHVGDCRSRMSISKAFKETYKKWKSKDQVTLQVGGKKWLVTCDNLSKMCRLRTGWPQFAKQNSLRIGDVCVFELIDACEKLIRVFIYRAANYTNCEGLKEKSLSRSEDKMCASADAFESKNPFFTIKLCPSYVYGGSMTLPLDSIKRCMILRKEHFNVILRVSDGRNWSVKCNVYDTRARMSAGWPQFVRENHLVPDDVCVFELINVSENLFNVVIFRTESSDC